MTKEFPTPLDQVQKQVVAYYDKMKEIAKFLQDNKAPEHLQIDPALEYLQVFIDRGSFHNLMGMWALAETNTIGVYFGLANCEDGKKFGTTCCFVALDANNRPVPGHFPAGTELKALVQPEDTWIPPKGILRAMKEKDGEWTLNSPREKVWNQFEHDDRIHS